MYLYVSTRDLIKKSVEKYKWITIHSIGHVTLRNNVVFCMNCYKVPLYFFESYRILSTDLLINEFIYQHHCI